MLSDTRPGNAQNGATPATSGMYSGSGCKENRQLEGQIQFYKKDGNHKLIKARKRLLVKASLFGHSQIKGAGSKCRNRVSWADNSEGMCVQLTCLLVLWSKSF